MSAALDEIRGWIPAKIRWEREAPGVEWRQLGELRLADPFFEDTLRKALSTNHERRRTPMETLGELAAATPGVPLAGMIFHLSRCGSTLVAQMLAAVEAHVVVSEAPPIDAIVGARAPEEDRVRWLRWLVSALGQRRRGDEARLFLKLDAWSTGDLPLFRRAFPGVPFIFVYRDPLEVLVSHTRQRGSHMVPGLIDPARLDLAPEDLALPLDAFGARVLASISEAGLRGYAEGGGRLVNHSELPGAVEEIVRDHFAVALTAPERERMLAASLGHAKRPGDLYRDDADDKRAAATSELRRLVEESAGPVYRRLESARAGAPPEPRARPAARPAAPPRPSLPSSVRLPLHFDAAAMLAEIEPLAYVAHFNSGFYSGDWSGVAFRAVDGKPERLHPDPTRKGDVTDTPLLARCPSVRRALEQLACPLGVVRVLRLGPGASIREHSDLDLSFEDGEARLHIPLATNPDVEFVVDGRRADMREGECWYHDFTKLHRVDNRGGSARLHLVVDCVVNDWLRRLLTPFT